MADDQNKILTEEALKRLLSERIDLAEEHKKLEEELAELENNKKRTFEEELKLTETMLARDKKSLQIKIESQKKQKKETEELLKQGDITDKQKKSAEESLKNIEEELKTLEDKTKELKLQNKLLDEQNTAASDVANTVESWLQATLGISSELSLVQKTMVAGRGSLAGGMKLVSLKAKDILFSFTNIANSISSKVIQATLFWAKSLEDVSASIASVTGQGRDMAGAAWDMSFGMNRMGVDLEKTSDAFKTLTGEITGFNSWTREQQKELVTTSGLLQAFGISADMSAQTMGFLTKSLGHTASETATISKDS